MCHVGRDGFGALLLQRCGGVAQGTGAITDIVDQYAMSPGDVTDDVHTFGDASPFAALINDRKVGVKPFGRARAPSHTPHVGEMTTVSPSFGPFRCPRRTVGRQQIVHGDVEKPLNLAGMQVQRQDAVGAGRVIRLATSFAEIGVRGPVFRSCRA